MRADPYLGRLTIAQEALKGVRSGERVLVGSGAAQPQHLVDALSARSPELADVEALHLMTLGVAPYADPKFGGNIRHNALFIGSNVRGAVQSGFADYTPCFLSEVPRLIRSGRLPVDVALIQVTPPEKGVCSLGVSVDILKAAVETARLVVAQVNPRMPWTLGDSLIETSDIDAFVEKEEALLELPRPEPTAAGLRIGRYVARLINDGDTLQAGIGSIPDAVLASLSGKKDLGIHSEMISDGVLDLVRKGVVTGRRKTCHPGDVVASFCLGTGELYSAVSRDPRFQFYPSDYVNAPSTIARNERMVSINSALQVDLTGQVGADSLGHRLISGFGGQVDFIRGAAASPGGRAIIALPSTAKQGKVSRIVPWLTEGTGVVTTRADVDFVVTEYGIASLKGKSIRERAVALIQIAHPDYRPHLESEAKGKGYLDSAHVLPSTQIPYRSDLEATVALGGEEVFFRPLKPTDLRKLKELFYSQSTETTYGRFGMPLKRLSEKQFQELVAIDYSRSVAIGAFVREGGRERLVAVGRYCLLPDGRTAEAAFTVHDRWQRRGIGGFLVDYLSWIARGQGLESLWAEVMNVNEAMRRIFRRSFGKVLEKSLGSDGVEVVLRLSDWKGTGNPALGRPQRARLAR